MKAKNHSIIAIAACGLFLTVQAAFPQGSLTPPGSPAPTMKSLDQIEPRIPISSVPYTITASGSYYLTTNLTGVAGQSGITIYNNSITLDLNGFNLQGVPGSQDGIDIQSLAGNITVRNGTVGGWGNYGVDDSYPNTVNLVFEKLTVINNGIHGILTEGPNVVVRDCLLEHNQANGIYCNTNAVISGCIANDNGNDGIYGGIHGVVRDCQAINNISYGIHMFSGKVSDCSAQNNGNTGIYAFFDCVVRDCRADNNNSAGINVESGQVSGCCARTNTSAGIELNTGDVSGCTAQNNDSVGIDVDTGSVSGCDVQDNGFGIAVSDGSVSGCHVLGNNVVGIDAGNANVSDCTVLQNHGTGIEMDGSGNVSGCTVSGNSGYGISYDINPSWGIVSGCTVNNNTDDGIDLYSGRVSDCTVDNNGSVGILLYGTGAVSHCTVQTNTYSGIYINAPGCEVVGNTCAGNNVPAESAYQADIFLHSNNNRVEDNHVTANGSVGIEVDSHSAFTGNVIAKNSVSGSGGNNYSVTAGNDVGPIGTAATSTSPWANISH